MKRFFIGLIFVFCFGQINWEFETVDSSGWSGRIDFQSTIALDPLNIAHVAYSSQLRHQLMYASRNDSGWQKEIIESGLEYFNPSLIIDRNNIPHLSYCKRDSAVDKTYLCHARRLNGSWEITTVDSCAGVLGYWEDFRTSIDLDTFGLPGIAYTPWNVADSIHYIKYSHFNGTNWDTSVVEYDSAYANIQLWPTDYNPSLKYSSKNVPEIAFYQAAARNDPYNDTIKYAYYDDTLNEWKISPVIDSVAGAPSISLALDGKDRPAIAYCFDGILAYAYWNGSTWQTEWVIGIGWTNISIALDIDRKDKPHIAFIPDPLSPSPDYCYKDSSDWHFYVPIGDSVPAFWISLVLDSNNNPHVSYRFANYGVYNGLRYAKGTFMGIEDTGGKKSEARGNFKVFPNPTRGLINIECKIAIHSDLEIALYDVAGSQVKLIKYENYDPGYYHKALDISGLSSGIYFIVLKQNNKKFFKKFLFVK